MMVISLFFSLVVYQLSVQEIDRGLQRPGVVIGRSNGIGLSWQIRDELNQDRVSYYVTAKNRIINRLLITNLIIIFAGGALSYYLARRTLKPIEDAHESLERFTADASHELRTPIAVMQSEIEVALMDPKLNLAKSKAILNSNLEELAKLTALSEGLLRLAQLDNDGIQIEKVNMNDVVAAAVDRVNAVATKRGTSIKATVPDKLTVQADHMSLTEALVILLDNAVKYSPDKSEVVVRVTKQPKEGVKIEVIDKGIGMLPTDIPHIFDRFYRSDVARSKQDRDGYGIGLAIAKQVIDAHHGKISVTSKPDKGSTFTIQLPS